MAIIFMDEENENNNTNLREITKKRIESLREISESMTRSMRDEIQKWDNISKKCDNETLNDFMFNGEEEIEPGMVQIGDNGITSGSNVLNPENVTRVNLNALPQNTVGNDNNTFPAMNNRYQPQQQYINTAPMYNNQVYPNYYNNQGMYYQPQQMNTTPMYGNTNQGNIYYQPQQQYNNTAPMYGGYYNNQGMYYQPQQQYVSTEYQKMVAEEQKRAASMAALNEKLTMDILHVDEKDYDKESVHRQIDIKYGICEDITKEEADIKKWTDYFTAIQQRNIHQNNIDLSLRGYIYDSEGKRSIKTSFRGGFELDGVFHQTTPDLDEYELVFTRQDDDKYMNDLRHWNDPYIREQNYREYWRRVFYNGMNSKYNDYTYEELMDGAIGDYYMDSYGRQKSKEFNARLKWASGNLWDTEQFKKILNCDPNYKNMSHVFYSNYDLAAYIHAANITKTPEELMNDEALNNKLREDYETRREAFLARARSKNLYANKSFGSHFRPDFNGHVPLSEMTVDEANDIIAQPTIQNSTVTVIDNPTPIDPRIPVSKRVIETGVLTDEELREFAMVTPTTEEEILAQY